MYKNILFDLDGTLTDPGEGITKSVAYALGHFGIEVNDLSQLNRFIGPPLTTSFKEFYGFSEEEAIRGMNLYRERYGEVGLFENKVYDGIKNTLGELKNRGYKLILATSKPEKFTKRIMDRYELTQYFDFIGCASMDNKRSEKADVIAYSLSECGIKNLEGTIMIGDRKFDILGAKANGFECIGVTYGYGSREELEEFGAKYIVDSPTELLNIFK